MGDNGNQAHELWAGFFEARKDGKRTQWVLIAPALDRYSATGQVLNGMAVREGQGLVLKRRIERRYLLTRYDRRRKMSQEIQQTLRERYAHEVCETVIIENVAIAESPAHNRDVFSHAETSVGAKNYTALFHELQHNRFI